MMLKIVLAALLVCAVSGSFVPHAEFVSANVNADPAELQYTITVGGQARTYYMYVPSAYNKSTNLWPLMVFFHGATDACTSGANFMISGFTSLQVAREYLFISACGINKVWSGPLDLPFAEAILDATTQEYHVDKNQIYGSGFSNGAGLTEYLGCHIPNRFTGLAIAAGWVMDDVFPSNLSNAQLLQNCDSLFAKAQSTVNILKLQGTVDPNVEPYGRTGVPGMRDDFYGWALRNGCKGSPTTVTENTIYKDEHFVDCPAGVSTRLVMLYGIPHQWVTSPAEVNYNTLILDNFNINAAKVSSVSHRSAHKHKRHHF